jgi:hypothetical protein
LVIALIVVGLSGGGGDEPPGGASAKKGGGQGQAQRNASEARLATPGVTVRLVAGAEVWVCLLDADGEALVNGEILPAGAEEGPFRSGSFTVSFGNGEVSMQIDGEEASIPETSSPIGYAIDESGELTPLSDAERPTCT